MLTLLLLATAASAPLALHPDNPRYFLFRGKPTVLVTSGEHYGAVLNLDFDYVRYLDALATDGLNHTRLFSGTYREVPASFGITDNTLAPKPGRYVGALGPQHGARRLRRRDEVRPLALGRVVLPAPEGLHGGGGQARRRRRDEPVLPLLRGGALGRQPDERPEQRERGRQGPARRGLHPEARRPDRRPGGRDTEDRHRAERVRQPLLRGRERAVLRRDHARVAAPRRGARRRDRDEAPEPPPRLDEHRQRHGEGREARARTSRSSTSTTRPRPTRWRRTRTCAA